MKKSISLNLLFLVGFIFFLSGCNSHKKEKNPLSKAILSDSTATASDTATIKHIAPTEQKPAWAPEITPEMQAILEKLSTMHGKPIETLTATEARQQPTPTDAVMALIKANNIPISEAKADTTGQTIPVAGGKNIHLRIYTPKSGKGPFPVIVYYHGGGWVIANLDVYNASAQALSEQVNAVVVSVAYRLAPENKYPAAHNDSYAAYEWVLKNAAVIKGDPKKVAVVGESAGGNLAASVSLMARDKKAQMPLHEVLIYPIAGYDLNTPSYQQYAQAKPLNKPMMAWFFDNYLPNKTAGAEPRISLYKANLKGMPATTIINAQLDPLLSDGELLAAKFKTDGVAVTQKTFKGVTHEFFGMAAILPEAKAAQALAAEALKEAFQK